MAFRPNCSNCPCARWDCTRVFLCKPVSAHPLGVCRIVCNRVCCGVNGAPRTSRSHTPPSLAHAPTGRGLNSGGATHVSYIRTGVESAVEVGSHSLAPACNSTGRWTAGKASKLSFLPDWADSLAGLPASETNGQLGLALTVSVTAYGGGRSAVGSRMLAENVSGFMVAMRRDPRVSAVELQNYP